MSSEYPLVSIGIPVYNGENFLSEALDCILAQTYPNIEILISDNCSTDSTAAICKDYLRRDSRIRYFRQPTNKGAAYNYNYVVHNTSGKYFKWASHDDLIGPDFIMLCVEQLEQDNAVSLAATKTTIIDKDGATLKTIDSELFANAEGISNRLGEYFNYYYDDLEANQVFGVYRRSLLLQSSLIANYPSSDLMLLGQIAMLGKITLIEAPIFYRRDHDNTSLRANRSSSEVAQWFDATKSKDNRPFPLFSRLRDYLTFTLKRPIGVKEKMVCFFLIAKWVWRTRWMIKAQAKTYFLGY